jgi:nucleotide-binding universal stress UspA family protein
MSELFVVGVDGSDGSRRALYVAAQAAQRSGARLLVAHVIADSPGADLVPVAPEVAFGRQEQEVEETHAHLLEPLLAEARDLGVPIEVKTLHGDPAATLAELAQVREASQIFIGREHHSRVHDLVFGNTLLNLARRTTVPLTLVP